MPTYKDRLSISKRYWEKQEQRVITGEYIPKGPPDWLIRGIELMIEKKEKEIFNYSLI